MFVFSCEHASNKIPKKYQRLFSGQEKLLNSHLAYDIGAEAVFDQLITYFPCEHIKTKYSRYFIEVNRRLTAKKLFSAITNQLSLSEKQRIIEVYYLPYYYTLKQKIKSGIEDHGNVVHLSIHSFTPNLNGIEREGDFGLLYDPSRTSEANYCKALQKKMQQQLPKYRIRRNYPYRGIDDGLTTKFRECFPCGYIGVEIEINQKLLANKADQKKIFEYLANALSI